MIKDKRENEFIEINCPKCKGKQGIRRKDSLIIKCFVCGKVIKSLEVRK